MAGYRSIAPIAGEVEAHGEAKLAIAISDNRTSRSSTAPWRGA
jgi:hypothetical protein